MIREKNFLLFFFIFIFAFLILKISLTKISYSLISKFQFNDFIISKYLADERLGKMLLLNKSKKKFETYFFGTSSATVYYPNKLKDLNLNSFNVSFSAANTSEHLKYLNWIMKNKTKPKKIYLELRDHSLLDHEYNVIMPPELLSFILKLRFYLIDFSTFKFLLSKITKYDDHLYDIERKIRFKVKNYVFLNTEQDEIIKENKDKKLKYVLTGTRYYQSYFDRKDSESLQKIHNKKIINNYLPVVGKKINEIRLIDLKKFIEICEINNIDYKIFFGPVYKSLLIRNKNEYLLRELFIIEQLFKKNILDKIYYFNNSEYSKNIGNFEKDLVHYNYDVAYKIVESLNGNINQNINNLTILTKDNIRNYISKID